MTYSCLHSLANGDSVAVYAAQRRGFPDVFELVGAMHVPHEVVGGGAVREVAGDFLHGVALDPVSYTHLTLPTIAAECRSRWSPYH